MLSGLIVKPLKRVPDERGSFTEVMRMDWKDLFGDDNIVQANFSYTYPDIIRAWHRHVRGQTDYFVALKGAIKICAYDQQSGELNEVVSTGENLQVVRVPGEYWHGFKAFGNEPALLLYFTTRLYDAQEPDEERRAWDDQTIVPHLINGKKTDLRVEKIWDWNSPPNK